MNKQTADQIIEQIRVIRLLCWPPGEASNPDASNIWYQETRQLRKRYQLTLEQWNNLNLQSND